MDQDFGRDLPLISTSNETDGAAAWDHEMTGLGVWTGVGIWVVFWLLRGRRDVTRKTDLVIFMLSLAWQKQHILRESLSPFVEAIGVLPLLTPAVTVLIASIWSRRLSSRDASADLPQGQAPWLLPSRTSHTRMFPKKHSFAYSLLQVAIPVGSTGRFNSLLSIGPVKRRAWYHVQASDYLTRNSEDTSLHSKLGMYLRSQGVQDLEWSYAYLITAPRFLGYAFNPVSFWYIYTARDVLAMMILEVNNTFDERRMYLLHAKDPEEKSEDSHSSTPPTPGDEQQVPLAIPDEMIGMNSDGKFRKAWSKDFHVSPFNSRKGYYMLTAIDPFGQKKQDEPPFFSNTITLKSSKDHVKLVARVFSDGKPINALTASWRDTMAFVVSWFWVGFLTFPRILKEAAMLFWKRGLHVWLRPEVLSTTIGRKEAKIERCVSSTMPT